MREIPTPLGEDLRMHVGAEHEGVAKMRDAVAFCINCLDPLTLFEAAPTFVKLSGTTAMDGFPPRFTLVTCGACRKLAMDDAARFFDEFDLPGEVEAAVRGAYAAFGDTMIFVLFESKDDTTAIVTVPEGMYADFCRDAFGELKAS